MLLEINIVMEVKYMLHTNYIIVFAYAAIIQISNSYVICV